MSQDAISCPFCAKIVPLSPLPTATYQEKVNEAVSQHNSEYHNPANSK